jgi:hypothetical protein
MDNIKKFRAAKGITNGRIYVGNDLPFNEINQQLYDEIIGLGYDGVWRMA